MDTTTTTSSSLHVITGPMFAGKTSRLIHYLTTFMHLGKKVLAIKHDKDNRYEEEEKDNKEKQTVWTHDQRGFPALQTNSLSEVRKNPLYQQARVVGIDEGQFFTELVKEVLRMVEEDHKIVYVSGLDLDSSRRLFGEIGHLASLADSHERLYGICALCEDGITKALYTRALVSKRDQILVGGAETYMPVCRRHYRSDVKKEKEVGS